MMNESNLNKEFLSFIQNNLNFNLQKIEDYDIELLKSSKEEIIILKNNFDVFFKFFSINNLKIKVKIFNNHEAVNVSKQMRINDVFGTLENGWILGRKKVHFYFGNEQDFSISYEQMAEVEWFKENKLFSSHCGFKNPFGFYVGISCDQMESTKLFFKDLNIEIKNWNKVFFTIEQNLQNAINLKTEKNLSTSKNNYLNYLDKDSNGEVDLVENDFYKLFVKNQKRIIEIDKNFVHQFVKVSNFIKTKKINTQNIFETIRNSSTQLELEEKVGLLKNQIHSYELLVFHSIHMIGSLISGELITFYEIYESFDKLGIFNSNWENEVSEKLLNIGNKLDELLYSIYNMEQNIVSELTHLNYITNESFKDLSNSVINQLNEVNSSINTNNLLTGIQAYQLYKINKNTSGLIR